jgi:hypothetical protein
MRWDWDPSPTIETWILDKIFDRDNGWAISHDDAPIKRITAIDGNPNYIVSVGRIEITVWETRYWEPGTNRTVSAGRLIARVDFTGITITNPTALLSSTYIASGLPCAARK